MLHISRSYVLHMCVKAPTQIQQFYTVFCLVFTYTEHVPGVLHTEIY